MTIQFSVKDSGIGVPRDQIPKLFHSFTQADGSTVSEYGGSGIRLIVCKRLVEIMGGEIPVHSELGQGSTFTFVLSFDRRSEEHQIVLTAPRGLHGIRVLVVVDNAASPEILTLMMKSFAFEDDPRYTGERPRKNLLRLPRKARMISSLRIGGCRGCQGSRLPDE